MKTISDHILDIVQNSVRARATLIEIMVDEDKKSDLCTLIIKDNGCGMDDETLKYATNPFFTSRKTRKVGLGLSLLQQSAKVTGGSFELNSKPGGGTEVKATYGLAHLDRQPFGNVAEMFYLTMLSYKEIKILYKHTTATGSFEIDSESIRQMLGDVPLQNKEIKNAIIELIENNLSDIEAIK